MYYGYGFDITYIFVIIGMVITLLASWRMKATFAKYEKWLREYLEQTESTMSE